VLHHPDRVLSGDTQDGGLLLDTLTGLTGARSSSGNNVAVLSNGDEIFPAMLRAIGQAQQTIEFLTFVYWSGDIADRFAEALAGRARAGVRVRVLLDSFGAHKMPRGLVALLENAGVELLWFRPLLTWRVWQLDNRTHRKVLVCDGRVAFTGGVGIAKEWQGDARGPGEWRDTHFRFEGPAVSEIRAAFWGNWLEASGGLGSDTLPLARSIVADTQRASLPSSKGDARVIVLSSIASTRWSDVATLMSAVFQLARRSLKISTAYFAPDESMARTLAAAAVRGVKVEIMFPGRHADKKISQRSSIGPIKHLIAHDVHMLRYDHTMLHQKICLVDDTIALIGSANVNHRSWIKDDEISVVVDDDDVVETLDRNFSRDTERCKRLTMADLKASSVYEALRNRALQVVRFET
jgi:cardiolipin synthase